MNRFKSTVASAIMALGVLASPFAAQAAPPTQNVPAPPNPLAATFRGVSTAVQFDVSPALRDIVPLTPADGPTPYERPEQPSGLEGPYGPQTPDTAVQSWVGPGDIPSATVSFTGPGNISGVQPPDPVGDVGPNHYIVMTNLSFQIFNKTGTSLYGPALNNTLWSGFGGACQTENAGDPVVLHDQFADRWILTQFTAAGPTYFNCVAISTTPDPTGTYYRYAFSTGSNFPDYPKYGVWRDSYLISTREFAGSTFAGVGAYALNRTQMLAGNPSPQVISFIAAPGTVGDENVGDGLLPVDIDGETLPPVGSPAYYMGTMDDGGPYTAPQDALTLWKFTIDWATPGNSSFVLANTIPVAAFDSIFSACSGRSCIPQPSTTNKIDILSYRQRPLHRLAYRNFGSHESLVTNQSVEAGSESGIAGIRWYELRSPNSSPVIYQQGTYAPGLSDSIHRWMGSAAMDHVGNLAVGYSASDATATFPSLWYTGRLAGDPLNTLPQGEGSIVNGTGAQTSGQRWGDYTSLNVDPVDDCTFWYVNEFLSVSGGNWQTRVGAFKFPNCSLGPVGTLTGTVTDASNSNPISGASIVATANPTPTVNGVTNGQGIYNLFLYPSTYTVTAAKYGYQTGSVAGVSVISGTTTTQNLALNPVPFYVVSGTVTDSGSGQPLSATITVAGEVANPPVTSYNSNPTTGFYSMTLASGQVYTLTAAALLHVNQSVNIGLLNGNLTQNIALTTTATNGGLMGYVRNFYTNAPVANALVSIAGFTGTATTNAAGYFQILNVPPGAYTATASANLYSPVSIVNIPVYAGTVAYREFLLPTAQLSYAPATLERTVMLGGQVTDTGALVITNTGAGDLTFSLQEQSGGFISSAVPQPDGGGPDPYGYTWLASNEPGGPTYNFVDISATGTALNLGDDGEGNITSTFSFPFYFSTTTALRVGNNGGILVGATAGDVSAGNAALTGTTSSLIAAFWDDIDSDTGNVYWQDFGDRLIVQWHNRPHFSNIGSGTFEAILFADGDILYQYLDTDFGNVLYNFGAGATVGIRGVTASNSLQYSFNTATVPNNFAICFNNPNSAGACGAGSDALPWLVETPISGTVLGGGSNSQAIDIGWAATSAAGVTQPGIYTGSLRLLNNDPAAQGARIPVTMTVLPAATQGRAQGNVSTTGICDTNPAPLPGAVVWFFSGSSTFSTTTNASGNYTYFLESGLSPYTLTVTAAQHPTTTRTINVTAGVTTTENFSLRLQQPCISAAPTSLSATLALGDMQVQTLTVNSTGALPANVNVLEVAGGGSAPDAFGYRWLPVTHNWIDATDGTALGLTDDSEANITSTFAFPYYAGSASAFRVGNNGALFFNVTAGDIDFNNLAMASAPNNFIAPFWDDMDDETGNVYWKEVGTAPNRQLIIEWYNRPHYESTGGVGMVTYQVILFENGNIVYQYQDTEFGNVGYDFGASATAGIRGGDAANSLQYSLNTATIVNGLSVCFQRPGATPCADIPWVSEAPTSTVGLTGTWPVAVTFDAAQVAAPGVYTGFLQLAHNTPQGAVLIPLTMNVTPPTNWGTVAGTVFGLGPCDQIGAPVDGARVLGSGAMNFATTTSGGGLYSNGLPPGAYTLTVGATNYVTQTLVFSVTAQQTSTVNVTLRRDAPCAATMQNAFSASQIQNITTTQVLTLTNSGAAALTWTAQEDPALVGMAVPSACGQNVTWLSLNPSSGSTPASGSSAIMLSFNSTGLATGVYTAHVCVASNDIVQPLIRLPVTMTVSSAYAMTSTVDMLAQSGNVGQVVTYTFRITNTGFLTDTYDMGVSNTPAFTTTTPSTVGPVAPGASVTVYVTVQIPPTATHNQVSAANIFISSQNDAGLSAINTLTTTAIRLYMLYGPVIRK